MQETAPATAAAERVKLGVFLSHPNQHQSVMFQYLSRIPELDTRVYYYDPGLAGATHDPHFGVAAAWDVDLVGETRSVVLPNLLRGRQISYFRQLNPSVVPIMRREAFDAVLLF